MNNQIIPKKSVSQKRLDRKEREKKEQENLNKKKEKDMLEQKELNEKISKKYVAIEKTEKPQNINRFAFFNKK